MTKKAIGISEFIKLDEEIQLQMLHQEGVHVGKRKVENMLVILFQLYGFYVEVYYRIYRKEVHHLIYSDSADILIPYLNQIHIKGLDKEKDDGN